MIRYLQHNKIDKSAWDRCIDGSVNSLIYACSWFLDVVSPGWDAIVEGDYEVVMPVTRKKKWGINYVHQPVFTQQLGVFSKQPVNSELLQQFLKLTAAKFKLVEYKLNFNNAVSEIEGFEARKNTNFILSLNKDYTALYNNFSDSHKKNIRRSERQELCCVHELSFDELTSFMENTLKGKIENIHHQDFQVLNKLLNSISQHVKIEKYRVRSGSKQTDNILSAACFIFFKKRIIFYSSSSEDGKNKKSMYFLINEFIKDHSNTDFILDFSGSNIPGIAYFFEGFGTEKQNYPSVSKNSLPRLINAIKRISKK